MTDRCRWAITFGTLASRCKKEPHEDPQHDARGLEEFPYQQLVWFKGDRREFETDRNDKYAWEWL